MLVGATVALAGGWLIAQAQPPGGGGRGGFANMTFDAINQADEDGNKDDHLTLEEVRAYFAEMMAGRGGGPAGGGGQDMAAMIFANWDTVPEGGDGMITEEEFNNRPQGRRGGGGFGGPPPQ